MVTIRPVPIRVTGSSKSDGWADPGWKWKIERVDTSGLKVKYDVTAGHTTRGPMYHQTLREADVARKV